MDENFTLFYLVDNIKNFQDIISPVELFDFDPQLSGYIAKELTLFEVKPPERLVKKILSAIG